jgi:hypothetical protein
MQDEIADHLDTLAKEANQLSKDLEYYWVDEGVSQLRIFIDPDLYQYLDKLYHESLSFAQRCQSLAQLAKQLRKR